jgi:hypothetical protein
MLRWFAEHRVTDGERGRALEHQQLGEFHGVIAPTTSTGLRRV